MTTQIKENNTKEVYMYDLHTFRYLLTFSSYRECAKFLNNHYSTISKRFKNSDFFINEESDVIITTKKFTRDSLRSKIRIHEDILCNLQEDVDTKGTLLIFNREGEKIGHVSSLEVLKEIQNISSRTLYRVIRESKKDFSTISKFNFIYDKDYYKEE